MTRRFLTFAVALGLCTQASATILYITTQSTQTGANWIYGWDVDANGGLGAPVYERNITLDTQGNSPLELPLAIWDTVRTTGRYGTLNPPPPNVAGYGHEYSLDLATKTPGPPLPGTPPDGDLHYQHNNTDLTDGTAIEATLPTIDPLNERRYNYSLHQVLTPGDRHTEVWVFDQDWANGVPLFRTEKNKVLNGISYDYRNYDGNHPDGSIWCNSDNGSDVYRYNLDYGLGMPTVAPVQSFGVRNSQFGLAFDPHTNLIWTHTGSNLYGWDTSGNQMYSQTATGLGGVPLVGNIYGMEMTPVILDVPSLSSNPGGGINFGPVLVPNAGIVPGGTTLSQNLYALVNDTSGSLSGITFPAVSDTVHFSPNTTDPNPPTPGGAYIVPVGGAQPRAYTYTPTVRTGYDGLGNPIYDEDLGHVLYSDDGLGNPDSVQTVPIDFRGRGVAPISQVDDTNRNAGYVLVGLSGTASITVNNLGDGNLDTRFVLGEGNLQGTAPAGIGEFALTSPAGISLTDYDPLGTGDTTTVNYSYTPAARGADSVPHTFAFLNGNPDQTNSAHNVGVTLQGTGVAPVSTLDGSGGTIATPILVGMTGTASILIGNVGDGDLAPGGWGNPLNNLNGSIPAIAGPFSAPVNTFNIPDPTSGQPSSQTFNYAYAPLVRGTDIAPLNASFTNGSQDNTNSSHTLPFTLQGQAVAPVNDVSLVSNAPVTRIGTTSTASVRVDNIGNGNLSGIPGSGYPAAPGGGSNLNGTATLIPDPNGFFSGGPDGLSLADAQNQILTYTYAPTQHGTTDTATVQFVFGNGSADQTNSPETVNQLISGISAGPVFSSVPPPGSTINFERIITGTYEDRDLDISNFTPDPDGGDPTNTHLSLLSYQITGPDASYFSLLDFVPGMIVAKGDTLLDLEVRVVGTFPTGVKIATLTILTDEDVPFQQAGNSYSWTLRAEVVTPEPATLTLLAFGGLGIVCRRRCQARRQRSRG